MTTAARSPSGNDGYITPDPPHPSQSLSGLLLLAATIAALVWANSPLRDSYRHFWDLDIAGMSLHHVINDVLMTLFFLMVGLEIKFELQEGALASVRHAALPIIGAVGGMLLPAGIYATLAFGTPAVHGWGIPMATDIAFAIGIMALLGDRVPPGLRIFLAALAIVDDLGAVLVIGLFYTAAISVAALVGVLAILAALMACNRRGVKRVWPYVLLGILLWVAVHRSGIHASIAGVLLAFTIPARGASSVEHKIERALQFPVSYVIIPLFGLANAGVSIPNDLLGLVADPAALATATGLVVGKPLGIAGAAWLAVRVRWASLPADASWHGLVSVSVLGGIGFTMSLFVANLAFGTSTYLDAAKLGILGGSSLAGIIGALLILFRRRASPTSATQ